MELVGKAEIVDDPERLWQLGVSVFERYYGAYTDDLKPILETMLHKRVAIKMHVERTVSWDHRKLGLPSTRPGGHLKFEHSDSAVAVPPARAMARTARPRSTRGGTVRDHIEVLEVVRHEDTGSRLLMEVRFAFRGPVSPAVQRVIDPTRCHGSPAPRSGPTRPGPTGKSWPTTIRTG